MRDRTHVAQTIKKNRLASNESSATTFAVRRLSS